VADAMTLDELEREILAVFRPGYVMKRSDLNNVVAGLVGGPLSKVLARLRAKGLIQAPRGVLWRLTPAGLEERRHA
jgi:hypothetical protein